MKDTPQRKFAKAQIYLVAILAAATLFSVASSFMIHQDVTAIQLLREESTKERETQDGDSSGTEKQASGAPPGTIVAFGGRASPKGWLICDGRTINSDKYPALATAIGETWGGLPGKPRLPDLRGLFLRGSEANNPVGTQQEDTTRMPRNRLSLGLTHIWYKREPNGVRHDFGVAMSEGAGVQSSASGDVGIIGGDPETRPKNAAVNWIIKY